MAQSTEDYLRKMADSACEGYAALVDADEHSITGHWIYLTVPYGGEVNQSRILAVSGLDFNGDLIVSASGVKREPLRHGITLRDRQIVNITSHDPQIAELIAKRQFILRDPKIELHRFVYWWLDEHPLEPQKRAYRRAKEAAE